MIGGATTKLGVVLVVAGALLMAGPVFGFSTLAADRGVDVGTAATDSALLAIEETGETPANQNNAVILNVTNNANERFDPLSAQAEITEDSQGALSIGDGFDTTLDPGATTGLELTCSSENSGSATVEVTADASGSSLSIRDVTHSHTFSYDCTSDGQPGPGFDSVFVSDVSGFVDSGDERQTISFGLSGNPQSNEQIVIDLSEPDGSGVYYGGLNDINVVEGSGNVWTNGDTITYQVSDQDGRDDEIVLSIGSYTTDGDGGPFDVTFTRTDTGEQGIASFDIDGEDGGDAPFVNVTAHDVSSSSERQFFSFTPGQRIESWKNVQIDVSEPHGGGVSYTGGAELEQGPGIVWGGWGDPIEFQANAENNAGKEIIISVPVNVTGDPSGTYEVTFTRTDTGYQTTDVFRIN